MTAAEQRTLPVQMFSGIRDQINPTIMAAATLLLALSIRMRVFVESYPLTRPSFDTIGCSTGTSDVASVKARGTSWVTNWSPSGTCVEIGAPDSFAC